MSTENKEVNEVLDQAEEVNKNNPETVKFFEEAKKEAEPKQEEVKAELTDVEKQAMSQGWRPQSEFDESREGKRWVPAQEYIDRGSYYKKIDYLNQKNKELEMYVKELANELKRTKTQTYEERIADLNRLRLEGIQKNDMAKFKAAEEAMILEYNKANKDLQAAPQMATQQQQQQVEETSPEQYAFLERNKFWFNNNSDENLKMVQTAHLAEQYIDRLKPELSMKDKLHEIELEIKRLYPHRFENSKKESNSPVLVSEVGGKSSNNEKYDLTPQQQKIGRMFVKEGIYSSLSEYAKDLNKRG